MNDKRAKLFKFKSNIRKQKEKLSMRTWEY
jgi:hypothetical protein